MKTINTYLTERLKLNSNSKISQKFHPKTTKELRSLLEQLLDERGPDADLNDIDVSEVDTFYDEKKDLGLFEKLDPHNINISKWDVSNVEDMSYMFAQCKNFTGQGLEKWKVNKVKDMRLMFWGCENFNCDLSNWNVSNVKYMHRMFKESGVEYNEKYPSWYKK